MPPAFQNPEFIPHQRREILEDARMRDDMARIVTQAKIHRTSPTWMPR